MTRIEGPTKKTDGFADTVKLIGGVAFVISLIASIVVESISDDK